MAKILIVDDDPALIALLEDVLQPDYLTVFASDGGGALHQLAVEQPDLILLDLRMPGMDGALLLTKIRELSRIPVIVLSARDTQADRVPALRAGADDFIAKPFDLDDLLARIETVLRRSRRVPVVLVGEIRVGELVISSARGTVRHGDVPFHVTPIEWHLLMALAREPNEVVSFATLLAAAWMGRANASNADDLKCLHMHIGHLRQKVGRHSTACIVNQRSVGYALMI